MAIYLSIRQVEMTPAEAVYEFGTSDGPTGLLGICKETGNVELKKAIPGDNGKAHFARASHKLKKHWNSGELPEVTYWAS